MADNNNPVLILVLMEDILLPLLVTKSKFIFDLRGEMAATTTNEVSSLSQAHFDEILVLMEHNSPE